MPLWGKNDATSRLAILDYSEEAQKADRIVFQVLPTDTNNGKYADAHTVFTDGESHILVLAYTHKETGDYSIAVFQERTSTRMTDSGDDLRTVDANCYRLGVSGTLIPITQNQSAYGTTYNGAGHTFSYTEATKFSQLAVAAPIFSRIPKNAEFLLHDVNTTDYDVTVLYALDHGEVQINTPVTELPVFSWYILAEYANVK